MKPHHAHQHKLDGWLAECLLCRGIAMIITRKLVEDDEAKAASQVFNMNANTIHFQFQTQNNHNSS